MILRWKLAQWFEAWWWRRYLRNKPVSEYHSWKKKYWVDFLEKAKIRVEPQHMILDAGCGPAGIFMVLPQNEVWAVDPLLEKYESQLPHFQRDRFEGVRFENVVLEKFSKPEKFDKVFCLNAINHVDDIEKCLSNLYVSLKKGGQLFLSVDAHNSPVLRTIFRLLPGDVLHPHQMDLDEYVGLTKKVGFQVLRTQLLEHESIFDYHLIVAEK